MKYDIPKDVTHKDVVVIGNGPSGIALSYMLDGNIPYVTSTVHPDDMLSARLETCGESLVHEDLEFLSHGLEGRSTNPVSLLLDSLTHPCADIGLEIDPLIEWRRNGIQIDHVVFGKGPPGGSWHSMDPHILTLSLGTWMALPGLRYTMRDSAEKRAFACNVAKYYEQYVKIMNLDKYFESGTVVVNIQRMSSQDNELIEQGDEEMEDNWVKKVDSEVSDRVKLCAQPEVEENEAKVSCPLTNVLNFLLSRGPRRLRSDRCCKRKLEIENRCKSIATRFEFLRGDLANGRDFISDVNLYRNESKCKRFNSNCDENRSASFSCNYDSFKNNNVNSKDFCLKNEVPNYVNCDPSTSKEVFARLPRQNRKPKWLVEVYDMETRTMKKYSCNNLVLANGASDLPNRLSISMEKHDPTWLLHDVRSLEIELNLYLQYQQGTPDPVVVVGAGLSAADAIIATRGKNVPVIHLFRNKSRDLSKQLPENMYPEYYKVHQMMQQGGSAYPLYTAYPEYSLTNYSEADHTVTITSNEGKDVQLNVSFAVILIGSRPDLSFLPNDFKIGVNSNLFIDAKTNPISINKLRHSVNGFDSLYAIGPIAGDNFVRFLPGGALAILSDLYKKCGY